jgi:hypothetical protein
VLIPSFLLEKQRIFLGRKRIGQMLIQFSVRGVGGGFLGHGSQQDLCAAKIE